MRVRERTGDRVSARLLIVCFLFIVATIGINFPGPQAFAAPITNRSLQLVTGSGGDGGSVPGGEVNHLFTFNVATSASIGSVGFEYCTKPTVVDCVTPTGLTTTSATLGDESHSAATGFSIVNTANGAPYLTRTTSNVTSGSTLEFRLDNITNPTTVGTFYVMISTYTSSDTSGGAIDTGTVAASTAQAITLSGTMPESLIFCTGGTITVNDDIPDCSTATSGAINFNQLFSTTDTATATSQMAASTNASTGYSITINGPTLTSGSNTIDAMASAGASIHGKSQFGMNLVANTTPAVGQAINPTSDSVNLKGQALANYATANSFQYISGDVVANSASGGAGPTNAQDYTASYIVNVPGNQTAGTYTTTLTYVCTATF